MFGSLFGRLPAIKANLGLGEGELALALLCGSVGLILSQPLAGALSAHFGSRRITAVGVALYGSLLVLPALAGDLAGLAVAFVASGASAGLVDVAMNTQGALAERRHPQAIFASFHAAFSFGAMGGAALAGLAAALDVSPAANLAAVGAAGVALGLAASRWMLGSSHDAAGSGPLFARPTGALAVLGAIALCAAMSEGAVGDWSAILLAESRGASESLAVVGLAAFSATMGIGRVAADPVRARLGARGLLRTGSLCVVVGMAAVVAPLGSAAAIAGFAVAGIGLAGLFPIALLLGSEAPGQPPAAGIAAVSTAGYAGFLVGPAVIGLGAELTSLPAALTLVIGLAVVVAALAPRAGADGAG